MSGGQYTVSMATPLDAYLGWYVPAFRRAYNAFARAHARADLPADMRPALRHLIDLLATGKKLRGALVQLGFECAAGHRRFLPASLAYELAHGFLLVHDDIMDKATVRRGLPTLHARYARALRPRLGAAEAEHLAAAIAITLGDLAYAWSVELLAEMRISPERRAAVLQTFAQIIEETVIGQYLDLTTDWRSLDALARTLDICRRKTAHYSVVGPLLIGSLLAGASDRFRRACDAFGIPIGVALQLRDDLLDFEADPRSAPEEVLADLRAGRPVYVVARAYRTARPSVRRALARHWGNPNGGFAELTAVRALLVETGAWADTERLLMRFVRQGQRAIPRLTARPELQSVLGAFAEFVIARRS